MLRALAAHCCFLCFCLAASPAAALSANSSRHEAVGNDEAALMRQRRAVTCTADTCKNGGVCNPYYGRPGMNRCLCNNPYADATYCEEVLDYCTMPQPDKGISPPASPPCLNGGTCTGTILTDPYFGCICVPGYTGSRCETNIDECASKPCVNGLCTDHVNRYSCGCYAGWEGINCEVNHDDCVPGACLHGGRCRDGNGSYTCDCTGTGFNGSSCEINIDDCATNPCVNGQCTDLVKNYRCDCYTGWEGSNCSVDTDFCATAPCLNGGKCSDGNSSFTCDCSATDFNGPTCNEPIDDCSPNPCQHGGRCIDGVRSFTCDCSGTGFSGRNCELNIDDCQSNPCKNGATCVDGVKHYSCTCWPGFSGTNCQADIQDCSPGVCDNHGICVERSNQNNYGNAIMPPPFNETFSYALAAGFVCICPPAFAGSAPSDSGLFRLRFLANA